MKATKTKTEKEIEGEGFIFTPHHAEFLTMATGKIPLATLSYKQYMQISDIQEKCGKVVEHYRLKASEALREKGLDKVDPNNINSPEEAKLAQELSLVYNTDSGVFTKQELEVFSEEDMIGVFESLKDSLSLVEFRALEYYLLKK